ncbi:Rod binding protein [Tistlia consotensis]|uniref:Rod binding protein n=1 Tax=Tistlia consotensis USBA 355 TaxID=560819 RepID=A0A1Y6CRH2_9PROT|nr:rod-binding protein [Tistlia consotensis]SMF67887.1 Rod binding protein [Tistlia consotensis USBA 355]SNR99400.1 Rod binding protein [Tistlia consotensis]
MDNSLISAQLQAAQNRADASSVGAAVKLPAHASKTQIEKTARDFEGMFLSEMLKPMFEGIKTDGMFGGGQAEDTYRGMLIQEYGKSIAQAGGIGLADEIAQEMLKLQEAKK